MRVAALLLCSFTIARAADPSAVQVKAAAVRAIARLQASQKQWFSEQSCSSCHHQFLPALAFRAAREHGIPVDEKIARDDALQAFATFTDVDRALEHAHVVDPGIGDALTLVAADAAGVRPSLVTAVYARLLAQRQKPDGHWVNFDERPPQSYSVFTATALAARAIDLYSHPSLKADARRRMDAARAWLASHRPADTEDRTFQLLGLLWTGADLASLKAHARELLESQRSDGGWGDVYPTGEALVALADSGSVPISDPRWRRGIQSLMKTQAQDGTWHVKSRLHPPAPLSPDYFESDYPYGHDQFLSAMGASWAVMALARALGPPHSVEVPPLKEVAPKNVPTWAETAIFGKDVNELDPNAATPFGTTVLMMAVPDAAKMKSLLDRGAKPNAVTKNGYSALLMSAHYTGSGPALQLLLDRGAELHPPGALFHAYPLVLAAIAGNAEAVAQLHTAGDGVDDIYDYAGLQPAPPLVLVSSMDETAVAKALLDAGAAVNKPDGDGLTALQWATLANKTNMARLLIERGADVNHVDKQGMTALLYAASIDFGDAEMINLLLNSGANREARTREGLTAQDLARIYNHTHLVPRLAR